MQALNETVSPRIKTHGKRRWLDKLVTIPPLNWWLRDPVSRASFLLTAAYLVRDRDVKLRVYPGIAPMLVIPFVFLLQGVGRGNSGGMSFGIPFSGVYLGLVPFLGLQILQYSQQWQAADVFRLAPIPGPARICHGARRAVLCFLALPMVVLMALIVWALRSDVTQLLLFIPGLIALPLFALVPNLGGKGVPLSIPGDAAKAAGRGLRMIGILPVAFALAGGAEWSWHGGWFWWFVLAEAVVAMVLYVILRLQLDQARWPSME